jgi:hypothetical protein
MSFFKSPDTSAGYPNGVTVSLHHDINRMTDRIAASVSTDLTTEINRKLLCEVCENLFGIADVELVRDTFEAIRLDPDIQARVVAIRTARRIGVR